MEFYKFKIFACAFCIFIFPEYPLRSQNNDVKFAVYNTLIGGITGGIGAVINKKEKEKSFKNFIKGFLIGSGGGSLMYGGKKLNALIVKKNELGYAWVSRAVFSAGNSIVENAAANRDFWSVWHFDVGFVRLEYEVKQAALRPKIMPSALGGIVYLASISKFDFNKSIRTGTVIFNASSINGGGATGFTPANGFVYQADINELYMHEVLSHEIIHTFQYQEFSGVNFFLKPVSDKWEAESSVYRKMSKWIHADFNHEIMLFNYFIIQKGMDDDRYCNNFLENEAEYFSNNCLICD